VSTWDPEVDPPGAKPIITSGGDDDTIRFQNPRDCTIEGFSILSEGGSYDPPIEVRSGTGMTIRNCTIDTSNFPTGNIMLSGSPQITIEGCTVNNATRGGISTRRHPGSMGGGDIYAGSHIVVKGCKISDSNQGGMQVGGAEPGVTVIIGGSGADQNIIEYNGNAGIICENVSYFTIDNNIVRHNGRAGIALVSSGEEPGVVSNNVINNHSSEAGINVVGASKVTIGDNNEIYGNYAGVALTMENMPGLKPEVLPSSKPVIIQNNHIYSNPRGGIGVLDRITGPFTISGNHIEQNNKGGIYLDLSYTNACEIPEVGAIEIMDNDIHDNGRGGIHTTGSGAPTVTIRRNKVYGNGGGSHGGGIDVRHASGIIENNLVYKNYMGGIRFGDGITHIINNTVVSSGFNNTKGGGIIYTDQIADYVTDPPTGTAPETLFIRNNAEDSVARLAWFMTITYCMATIHGMISLTGLTPLIADGPPWMICPA
jgi:parallel beta-helix repeat protein